MGAVAVTLFALGGVYAIATDRGGIGASLLAAAVAITVVLCFAMLTRRD